MAVVSSCLLSRDSGRDFSQESLFDPGLKRYVLREPLPAAACIWKPSTGIGSLEVGSFHIPPIKLIKAVYALWSGMGASWETTDLPTAHLQPALSTVGELITVPDL